MLFGISCPPSRRPSTSSCLLTFVSPTQPHPTAVPIDVNATFRIHPTTSLLTSSSSLGSMSCRLPTPGHPQGVGSQPTSGGLGLLADLVSPHVSTKDISPPLAPIAVYPTSTTSPFSISSPFQQDMNLLPQPNPNQLDQLNTSAQYQLLIDILRTNPNLPPAYLAEIGGYLQRLR